MRQPALRDNVLAMHLGGPKRVHRWRGRQRTVTDVDLGSLTLMPAIHENHWRTEGPIDYAHVTLSTGLLTQVAAEEFGRDFGTGELLGPIGFRSPPVEQIFTTLLACVDRGERPGRLYSDSLLVVLSVALLRDHSTLSTRGGERGTPLVHKGGLAGRQLRRVVDYMVEHLGRDIALGELTDLTGLSRAQFFRAFKQTTGTSPQRFLTRLRVDHASRLLERTDLPLDDIASTIGLGSQRRLSAAFRDHRGVSPRHYRVLSR